MKKGNEISRRKFFASSALGAGAVGLGAAKVAVADAESAATDFANRSPREPLVLTLSGAKIDYKKDVVKQIIERMEITATYKPDIICLPEGFATPFDRAAELAEPVPGPLTNVFSAYAKKHNCYVICPLYTRRSGKLYNTAVLIGRQGEIVGMYDKIHPTEQECDAGIIPGREAPVFKTDFGTIGMMICFDVNWMEEWRKLKEQGAEIVFWASAYPGGRLLSMHARVFKYYVVGSSLTRDPAPIFDMTGDLVTESGTYEHWAMAYLNLEKIHCEIDFHVKKVKQMQKKYGRKVKAVYYHDEDWVTIESRSPDLTIRQLIDEYGLVSNVDYIKRAGEYQDKFRPR